MERHASKRLGLFPIVGNRAELKLAPVYLSEGD